MRIPYKHHGWRCGDQVPQKRHWSVMSLCQSWSQQWIFPLTLKNNNQPTLVPGMKGRAMEGRVMEGRRQREDDDESTISNKRRWRGHNGRPAATRILVVAAYTTINHCWWQLGGEDTRESDELGVSEDRRGPRGRRFDGVFWTPQNWSPTYVPPPPEQH